MLWRNEQNNKPSYERDYSLKSKPTHEQGETPCQRFKRMTQTRLMKKQYSSKVGRDGTRQLKPPLLL